MTFMYFKMYFMNLLVFLQLIQCIYRLWAATAASKKFCPRLLVNRLGVSFVTAESVQNQHFADSFRHSV